ncbi:MAG: hypothetical protein NT166_07540 [Candidatus Aminicenantes bacterium]|nr:hypothetical protein [Candidatus Aminicenantes bacterium]
MLKPNKHLDPRFSVIHVGGLILKTLKDKGILTFDELLSILRGKIDVKVKEVYLPSLSFLFLLGKIQYHRKIDSFELITS